MDEQSFFTFPGFLFGCIAWFIVRYVIFGFFTVNQNERAVKTSFGRAARLTSTTLDNPMSEFLRPDEKERYKYPQVDSTGWALFQVALGKSVQSVHCH
jgi:regulator of protease activity HflC (stomatin/prohibitin superfamily)